MTKYRMRKSAKRLINYLRLMWMEVTLPAGTQFELRVNGEMVKVSRLRHIAYMSKVAWALTGEATK